LYSTFNKRKNLNVFNGLLESEIVIFIENSLSKVVILLIGSCFYLKNNNFESNSMVIYEKIEIKYW